MNTNKFNSTLYSVVQTVEAPTSKVNGDRIVLDGTLAQCEQFARSNGGKVVVRREWTAIRMCQLFGGSPSDVC